MGWQLYNLNHADVDGCSTDPCGEGGTCITTPGSYSCQCDAGYMLVPFPMETCEGLNAQSLINYELISSETIIILVHLQHARCCMNKYMNRISLILFHLMLHDLNIMIAALLG